MRVTLCRSGGSEVHDGQKINQLRQMLLIGPFLELSHNPSLKFIQLKGLISPHDATFLEHSKPLVEEVFELKVRPFA